MIDAVSWLEGESMPGTVLIILNQAITRTDLFDLAWDSCTYHVVTDGAANRLRALNNEKYIPDLIVGDFDSITSESMKFYKDQGVEFVTDEDQYATDFMKAMKQSHTKFDKTGRESRRFLAFGALGGRVDHTWHSYLCLSIAGRAGDLLVLISDENITFSLGVGAHDILTPREKLGPTCGYAPLEGSAEVETLGFEWDVNKFDVSFTSQLSTSNHLTADKVWLRTSKPLMFTVELR